MNLDTQDLRYEEEILRNPYLLKAWTNYLDFKKSGSPFVRFIIFERALKHLPRSYKLWHAYLIERENVLELISMSDKRYRILVNTYERALIHMHKMPVIWQDYCTLLAKMKLGTATRHACDRALKSLPITQHGPIWEVYIRWAGEFGVPETAIRVYRRYMMYDPLYREDFINYLIQVGQMEEAAKQLSLCLDDEQYVSPYGHSRHQIWMKLCDLCGQYPEEVSCALKVDSIIRSGINTFTDEVGMLWCKLADYYIRLGQFEKVRDIYEEAIHDVKTVRDFTVVFDAYVKFEESVLMASMKCVATLDTDDTEADDQKREVELRLARMEYMVEQRPLLLNDVILRQNPHNVHEWMKRIRLQKKAPKKILSTYMEAIETIKPSLAKGKLCTVWLSLANYYEFFLENLKKENDKDVAVESNVSQAACVENARGVYRKASAVNFRTVEECASVWCAWVEMELRQDGDPNHLVNALNVAQQATTEPSTSFKRRKALAKEAGRNVRGGPKTDLTETDDLEQHSSVDHVHKNIQVWSLYLDLEESIGTIDTCRAAYDKAMDLKVITPSMALNCAAYFEDNKYFEDSFRVYERALTLFSFPHVKPIWITYLDKFIARYQGKKLERLRDLFEQAVSKVPADDAVEFYVKYAKAEEQFGLSRHAILVYDRATKVVPEADRLDMYRLYIRKVEEFYGITKTRAIYERAVSELLSNNTTLDNGGGQVSSVSALCVEFADMERKLGEIDRARGIYQHGSQFIDTRKDPIGYWKSWKLFEEAHGNEDTYRDMLRVKRSVEIAYSQANYLAAEMMAGTSATPQESSMVTATSATGGADSATAGSAMDQLNRQATQSQLASSEDTAKAAQDAQDSDRKRKVDHMSNPDELDIDDEEDSTDPEGLQSSGVTFKSVPAAVFGSIVQNSE